MLKPTLGASVAALLVAGASTGVLALMHTDPLALMGVFAVYLMAVHVNLQFRWVHSAASRGGASVALGVGCFGVLCLAQGVGPDFDFGALALGVGLLLLGIGIGIGMREATGGMPSPDGFTARATGSQASGAPRDEGGGA